MQAKLKFLSFVISLALFGFVATPTAATPSNESATTKFTAVWIDDYMFGSGTYKYNFVFVHPTIVLCEAVDSTLGMSNCFLKFEFSYSYSPGPGNRTSLYGQILDSSGQKVGSWGEKNGLSDITITEKNNGKTLEGYAYFSIRNAGSVFISIPQGDWGTGKWSIADTTATPISVRVMTKEEKAEAVAAQLAADRAVLASRKLTVTCKMGAKKKTVIGDPPKCPSGYRTGMESHKTFSAYVGCKLYKRDQATDAYADLLKQGRELEILVPWISGKFEITDADLSCVLRRLGVSSNTVLRMNKTRAIDGLQTARQGPINLFWSYHPDDGFFLRATYLK